MKKSDQPRQKVKRIRVTIWIMSTLTTLRSVIHGDTFWIEPGCFGENRLHYVRAL